MHENMLHFGLSPFFNLILYSFSVVEATSSITSILYFTLKQSNLIDCQESHYMKYTL
jgi:hypothetical protein